jgi:hypothetical protein
MIQAQGELVSMMASRGEAEDNALWTRYGAGASISPFELLAISAEIVMVADISEAPAFNGIFAAGGLHLDVFGAKISAGAQVPIQQKTGEERGTAIGSPSEINVIARAGFRF